jgi:hypothetical protein
MTPAGSSSAFVARRAAVNSLRSSAFALNAASGEEGRERRGGAELELLDSGASWMDLFDTEPVGEGRAEPLELNPAEYLAPSPDPRLALPDGLRRSHREEPGAVVTSAKPPRKAPTFHIAR